MVLLFNGSERTIKKEALVERIVELYKSGYTFRGIRMRILKETSGGEILSTITIKKILDINHLIPDKE